MIGIHLKKSETKGNMVSRLPSHAGARRDRKSVSIAFGISAFGHVILFVALIFSPEFSSHKNMIPAAITVNMVTLPSPGPPGAESQPSTAPRAEKKVSEPPKTKVPLAVPKPAPPPEAKRPETVSLAPKKSKPKLKKSLKKKTFKPRKVVKRAIKRLEKQVQTTQREPLQDVFSNLRRSVEKQASQKQPREKPASGSGAPSTVFGGGGGTGGGRVAGVVDIYRLNTAMQIEQNWAFSHQLAGRKKELKASLVFKIFPSGEIRDVFFTERSGNRFLDESAYKAIVKSNPVKPHPTGVVAPYIEMGLRFTPEGIR